MNRLSFLRFRLTILGVLSLVSLMAGGARAASLSVYSSEDAFLAAAPIVSTETFDDFATDSGFDSQVAKVDEVIYTISSALPGDCLGPCWRFSDGLSDGPPPVTAPNYFFSNEFEIGGIEVAESLTFGRGRSAKALGFYFHSAISADWLAEFSPDFLGWQIVVNEINGNSSTFFLDPSFVGSGQVAPPYFGFLSNAGVDEVLLYVTPESLSAPNWAYDNVSRSTVVPLPASLLLFGSGLGLLSFVARREGVRACVRRH